MDIEELICDLIMEDKFKAKYTKRQRSIFCKNMYTKISTFLNKRDDELMKKHQQKLYELDKIRYQYTLLRENYQMLSRRHRISIYMEVVYSILNLSIILYFYYSIYQWFTKSTPTDQSPRQLQIM